MEHVEDVEDVEDVRDQGDLDGRAGRGGLRRRDLANGEEERRIRRYSRAASPRLVLMLASVRASECPNSSWDVASAPFSEASVRVRTRKGRGHVTRRISLPIFP